MTNEINKTTSDLLQSEITDEIADKDSKLREQIEKRLNEKIFPLKDESEVGNEFKQDLKNFEILKNLGLINSQQEQNLLNGIFNRAITEKLLQNMRKDYENTPIYDFENVLKEFDVEKPKFFSVQGRNEVLNYLKNSDVRFDKDELSKISDIVEIIEKTAIDRYLQKAAYEESLEKSNSEAKQKLKSNAQDAKNDGNNFSPFTRAQIEKLSNADFLKYEDIIMQQLKNGLIK